MKIDFKFPSLISCFQYLLFVNKGIWNCNNAKVVEMLFFIYRISFEHMIASMLIQNSKLKPFMIRDINTQFEQIIVHYTKSYVVLIDKDNNGTDKTKL